MTTRLVGLFLLISIILGTSLSVSSQTIVTKGSTSLVPLMGATQRISVSATGEQGNNDSWIGLFTNDSQYVTLYSHASNLIPNDTNVMPDAFLKNIQTGEVERLSIGSNGEQGNGASGNASLSSDNRYAVFDSYASSLVPNDLNSTFDVFLRDRILGQTRLISLSSTGTQGNSSSYLHTIGSAISADGRYVTFQSVATNLVANDTNGKWDIFVRDLQTNQTERVSVSSDGTQGNGDSVRASISRSGRYVVFESEATNLVANDTNTSSDIFVFDRQTHQIQIVSISTDGAVGNDDSQYAVMSGNEQYVTFESWSSNFVSNETLMNKDIFVYDLQTSQIERVSEFADGQPTQWDSFYSTISDDGRYVAFSSYAPLVPNDTSDVDSFVYDRLTKNVRLVSQSSSGEQSNSITHYSVVSPNGRYVTFQSLASNLIPNDTNDKWDVFLHEPAVDYLISGHIVKQVNGVQTPAVGVTVRTNTGMTTTTNNNGDYSLIVSGGGNYTITPSYPELTFWPQNRQINVTGDTNNINFTALDKNGDEDGDALRNSWEVEGYDHDGNGNVDVDLPRMGADPLFKDVFVEIDYVEDPTCSGSTSILCFGRSFRPNDKSMEMVRNAFLNQQIALHIDYGPQSIMNPRQSTQKWGSLSQSDALPLQYKDISIMNNDWSAVDQVKEDQQKFRYARWPIFHYSLFIEDILDTDLLTIGKSRYDGNLPCSLSLPGGSDFVIAMGAPISWKGVLVTPGKNTLIQSVAFMHELGHNLGLCHGGQTELPYNKPNYLSVMNYLFKGTGLTYQGKEGYIDYSRFDHVLRESSLNESTGLGSIFNGYGTRFICPTHGKETSVTNANGYIDWNCSGTNNGSVSVDINGNGNNTDVFTSTNDWSSLSFSGGYVGEGSITSLHKDDATHSLTDLKEPTYTEIISQTYPYFIMLGDEASVVTTPGVVTTLPVTLTNVGELTATITLTTTSSRGWFNTTSIPTVVTVPPSSQRVFSVILSAPSGTTMPLTDELTVQAMVQESPIILDEVSILARVGPKAAFEVDHAVNQTVTFTDKSLGRITAWSWDFGDGTTSIQQNPVHTYQTNGIYTVRLTVSGPDGSDTFIAHQLVNIIPEERRIYLPLILR